MYLGDFLIWGGDDFKISNLEEFLHNFTETERDFSFLDHGMVRRTIH